MPEQLESEDIETIRRKVKIALDELNKPVSKEALRKQNEELDRILREKGLKAYNDELFRRVGLG
ncbi:MAG: hypothetical protein ABIA93_00930 [Candidatus Woesearchaeota archaeon]